MALCHGISENNGISSIWCHNLPVHKTQLISNIRKIAIDFVDLRFEIEELNHLSEKQFINLFYFINFTYSFSQKIRLNSRIEGVFFDLKVIHFTVTVNLHSSQAGLVCFRAGLYYIFWITKRRFKVVTFKLMRQKLINKISVCFTKESY